MLFALDEPFLGQEVQGLGAGLQGAAGVRLFIGFGRFPGPGQAPVQQPVGVVEGRPEHLSAGQVLERGGDAPAHVHGGRIQGPAGPEARQGGAVGPQEKDGLHQVAAGLFHGQGRQFGVVERALAHDPVHGQGELLADLVQAQFGNGPVAAPLLGQEPVGVLNGPLPSLDGYIHDLSSTEVVRGMAQTDVPLTKIRSTPRG